MTLTSEQFGALYRLIQVSSRPIESRHDADALGRHAKEAYRLLVGEPAEEPKAKETLESFLQSHGFVQDGDSWIRNRILKVEVAGDDTTAYIQTNRDCVRLLLAGEQTILSFLQKLIG